MKVTKKQPAPKAAPRDSMATAPEDIKWRARDAMRTIHEAAAIKKDRELMKHVKRMAKETMKACG